MFSKAAFTSTYNIAKTSSYWKSSYRNPSLQDLLTSAYLLNFFTIYYQAYRVLYNIL